MHLNGFDNKHNAEGSYVGKRRIKRGRCFTELCSFEADTCRSNGILFASNYLSTTFVTPVIDLSPEDLQLLYRKTLIAF